MTLHDDYDILWLHDNFCQVKNATEIVIRCRKASQDVAICHKVMKKSQKVVEVSEVINVVKVISSRWLL